MTMAEINAVKEARAERGNRTGATSHFYSGVSHFCVWREGLSSCTVTLHTNNLKHLHINFSLPFFQRSAIREHEQAVIIVPTLLLFGTLLTLLWLFLLRYCPEHKRTKTTTPQRYHASSRRHTQRQDHRHHLQGIDAPPGINPLEHEELPMSVQPVQQNVRPSLAVPPLRTSTERHHNAFSEVAALPLSFSIKPNNVVSLYRARMDNKDVVLRVLKDTANGSEKQHFLGFTSFVSGLGPHPFIPALLGVVSVQPPLMMVVEELRHRDLLGFLWRCRQDNSSPESSCDMTEKRIFTMAGQVASALEYLHSQGCVHGNVGARSVLVGGDLTAKLWGLGPAYRRRAHGNSPVEVEDVEMRKWQAPEVLGRRGISQSSDVYSIIKSCCHWSPQQRLSVAELIRKLQAGEKSANGRTVLRVPEPPDIEKYLREAGCGEAYNYAVL
ncbi:hypothetical protein L3Q82_015300 [Scortum barcoo]|uniref:Uncharacterized protein n=1 Tax=Scortum barcoo TaxID=214431 RepID=A0ACB8VVH6_9TELE|nr:hypothetical protein L3Q82_015300 [Scortum barcoo]